jgi:hypothetical protein
MKTDVQPISITAVLLPFVTYLLTHPRKAIPVTGRGGP